MQESSTDLRGFGLLPLAKKKDICEKKHIFIENFSMNHLPFSKKFLPLHPQSRNKHRFEKAKSRNATTGWPVRLSVRTQDFHS